MLHMHDQMRLFGPGRHHWCLRFEAKHAFFNGLKFKSYILSKIHQMWLCFKQLGANGVRSPHFIYIGVEKGGEVDVTVEYPTLVTTIWHICPDVFHGNACYSCEETESHGLHYKKGCITLLCSTNSLFVNCWKQRILNYTFCHTFSS